MNKPLFSIVIPTYNHAHLIRKCLDGLLSQTFGDWEAIVVNNFSEDDTEAVVAGYNDPRIRLVNNANGGIIGVSRNKGVELAQGEWICFLDSDDWWSADKLEACLPWLAEYDFLYHDMEIFYENSTKRKALKGRSLNVSDPYADMLLYGNPCINSSAVVRRSVVEQVGRIDVNPDLIAVEDFDYWLRVVRQTKRIKHIAKKLGYYWVGGSNMSFNVKQIGRIDNLYAKHLPNIPSAKLRSEILKCVSYRQGRIYQSLGQKAQAREKFRVALSSTHLYTSLRALLFLTFCR